MQQNYISTHHFGASGSQKQLRGCIPSTLAHLDSSSNYGAPLGANAIAHGSLVHVPAESATPLTASGAYGYVHSMDISHSGFMQEYSNMNLYNQNGNCAAHPLPFYPPTSASVSLTSAPFPSHDAQAQYASPESVNWSTYNSIDTHLAPDAPSTLNAYPKNLTTSAHITHTHTQSFAAPGHVTFGVDYTVPPTHNLVNVGSGAGTATTPAGLGMGGLAPGGWPLPHIAPIARYRSSDLHPGQTMGGWPKSHDSELGTVHRHTIVPQRDFRDAHHLTAYRDGIGGTNANTINEIYNPRERIVGKRDGFGNEGDRRQIASSSSLTAVEQYSSYDTCTARINDGQSWGASARHTWEHPTSSSSSGSLSSQSSASRYGSSSSSTTSSGSDSTRYNDHPSTFHVQPTHTQSFPSIGATLAAKPDPKPETKVQGALKPIKPRQRHPRGLVLTNCSGPLSSQVEKDRREAKERQEERKRIHQEKKAAEKAQKEEEKRGRELVHDGGGRKRTRRSVIDDGWTW
ncbi:hypothetical protein BDN70DRAFT_994347 [Pholiota conissans]|uniref:Uncharacterized protein n=1 Tax=Pholiota conissans TaxID=109636 RepID=A0A9P6D023_9AGAR|nr:hypothetical protein BDN70DRAFT_994347 [Pholiota conissans]